MNEGESEEERQAAARADLIAYMRKLPKEPVRPSRPIHRGSSAVGAFRILGRIGFMRPLLRRLVIVVLMLLIGKFLLPGRGLDLSFIPGALWQAAGTLSK